MLNEGIVSCIVLFVAEVLTTVAVAPWFVETEESPVEDFCRPVTRRGKITFDG